MDSEETRAIVEAAIGALREALTAKLDLRAERCGFSWEVGDDGGPVLTVYARFGAPPPSAAIQAKGGAA